VLEDLTNNVLVEDLIQAPVVSLSKKL